MVVPFLDLKAQYRTIKEEVDAALHCVIDNTAFAGGPFVEAFERNFADYCRCCCAIGVGSGTEALWLTLKALGVGPGDEVITVPNTFIATAEAVTLCGGTPVFVDVDERSYTLNPALLEKAISRRTKGIIPVHLLGQTAEMDPIMACAEANGLFVVEDACQAHGATYRGRPAGSIGNAGCFSFYPGKNLGAYGEAGGVVTNNEDLAAKIKMLRDHGQSKKYWHDVIGVNSRMDGLQGAVLSVKLKYLDQWNDARRRNAAVYATHLSGEGSVSIPAEMPYGRHVFHVYALRAQRRNGLAEWLNSQGISTGVHYPVPIHLQEAYRFLGYAKGDFPVSEQCAEEFISLPMYPELSSEQIETVGKAISEYYGSDL